jgi:hypothetical protein
MSRSTKAKGSAKFSRGSESLLCIFLQDPAIRSEMQSRGIRSSSHSVLNTTASVKLPNIGEADIAPWGANWTWGLPLILLAVVIHVFGLVLINDRVVHVLRRTAKRRSFILLFAINTAAAVLLSTVLR